MCNVVDLPRTSPTYHTDKQYKYNFTVAIPLCDIISIYIFTSYTTLIILTILSVTALRFLATCFGRIGAIFRPTCTDLVPSICVQYGVP